MRNKRGQIWISAALYTALGVILVTLILSVGMPFVNKLKARNTVLQTKNVMYEFDGVIREVYGEGYGSKRPLFVDIGEGEFIVNTIVDKISWNIFSEDKLGIEATKEGEPPLIIQEGNLNLKSIELGQGYQIEMFLDYGSSIDLRSKDGLEKEEILSGQYNLVVVHNHDGSVDYVEIKE